MIVILVAFVLTWFFRVPPLRKVSALQQQADAAAAAEAAAGDDPEGVKPEDELERQARAAADLTGSPVAASIETGGLDLTSKK